VFAVTELFLSSPADPIFASKIAIKQSRKRFARLEASNVLILVPKNAPSYEIYSLSFRRMPSYPTSKTFKIPTGAPWQIWQIWLSFCFEALVATHCGACQSLVHFGSIPR